MVVGTTVLGAVLLWRLNTGPLSLGYLTPYFEAALSPGTGRYSVRIEDTILELSEEARALNVKLLGVRVLDVGGTTLIRAPELQASLSAAALLRGQFAPRSLTLSGATIRVIRTERGNFDFGAQGESFAVGEGASEVLTELMGAQGSGHALDYLARVNIINSQLTIDDRMLDIEWSVPDVNIAVIRTASGFSGATDFDIKVGDHIASLAVSADYRSYSRDLSVTMRFAELRPRALSSVADTLAFLAPFDVPLTGIVAFNLTNVRDISRAEFNVLAGPGRMSIKDPAHVEVSIVSSRMRGAYDSNTRRLKFDEFRVEFGENGRLALPAPVSHAFPVRELVAEAVWSQEFGRLDIGSFRLALDKPVIEGTAAIQQGDGGFTVEGSARAAGLTFNELAKYWPESLARDPRRWVLRHIPTGSAHEARIRIGGRYGDANGFELHALSGELATNDSVVDYLPPMPRVVKSAARARFDRQHFDIAVLGGESAGLTVKGGRIVISDLDKKDQWTDVDLAIDGPLGAAIAYIDSPPFGFARDVGISPKDAKGSAATRLKLRFIAENRLTIDEIKINADAAITDAALSDVAFGLGLSDGDLKLAVDNAGMDVKGTAELNGIRSDLAWRQNFAKNAPFVSRYQLKAFSDADDFRKKMGLDSQLSDESIVGPVGLDLTATFGRDRRGEATAEIDLGQAKLALDPFDWSKPAGEPARALLQATFQQGKVAALPKISVTGGGLTFLGEAVFASNGKVASARVDKLAVGETDISGTLFPRSGGWEVDIRGRQLDLKRFMEDKTPEDPNAPRKDALAVSVNLERVRMYEDRYLNGVSGVLGYDGLVWTDVRLKSGLVDGGKLDLELTPAAGRRRVTVTSDNAGSVLRALDINDNMIGGRLNIAAEYNDMKPASCLSGRVNISDYRLRNAPVLARLLNAASIVGLLQSLGGEGIHFDGLDIPFTRKDGVSRFERAKASGLSIGLTAKGAINSLNETVDVEGYVVPANLINSVLSKIPLLGRLFGGEGGLFAIDYKVKGDVKDPDVSANPLTVLTPGFTREIFDVFDRKEETPPGCLKAG